MPFCAFKQGVSTCTLLKDETVCTFNFCVSFSLVSASVNSYLDSIDRSSLKEAQKLWREQASVLRQAVYLVYSEKEFKESHIPDVKLSIKSHIKQNAEMLAFHLGIFDPVAIEHLYPLSDKHFLILT